VLAREIYAEGIKNVTADANPMDLKRGIDYGQELCRRLKVILSHDF
jgi:chaperonin GroEL (HSP60 family)